MPGPPAPHHQLLNLRSPLPFAHAARSQLTPSRAEAFYAEHKGKPFFPTLVSFMSSGPLVALALAREDAIKGWRALMGPTNSQAAREAAPKRCVYEELE